MFFISLLLSYCTCPLRIVLYCTVFIVAPLVRIKIHILKGCEVFQFHMLCTFLFTRPVKHNFRNCYDMMEIRRKAKEKQRKIANINDDYGDGDLELTDSDENDETNDRHESNPHVSFISKSDSGIVDSGLS